MKWCIYYLWTCEKHFFISWIVQYVFDRTGTTFLHDCTCNTLYSIWYMYTCTSTWSYIWILICRSDPFAISTCIHVYDCSLRLYDTIICPCNLCQISFTKTQTHKNYFIRLTKGCSDHGSLEIINLVVADPRGFVCTNPPLLF